MPFTQFHNWVTGDLITAALLNGEISSIVTAGNAIDFSFIGPNGLYASNLKPTNTTQGTFGGTVNYTFPQNVLLAASAVTSASSVGIWNDNGATNGMVLNVPTNPTNSFQFQMNGATKLQLGVGTGGIAAANVGIANDNAATNGLTANVPTGSTNGYRLQVNGTTLGQLSATGDLQVAPLINALNVLTRVIPAYNNSGTALAGTLHAVIDTVSFANVQTVTVTFGAGVKFTSGTSYVVVMVGGTLVTPIQYAVNTQSATGFTVNTYTTTGTATNITTTAVYMAIGT